MIQVVEIQVAVVGGVDPPAGALDAHCRDLELGHLRGRVDGPVGELVAARAQAQWYGMNTVSGVVTTCAGRVIVPRLELTVTLSHRNPGVRQLRVLSHNGSGYCATSPAMRRVWVPDRYWLTTRPVVSQIG